MDGLNPGLEKTLAFVHDKYIISKKLGNGRFGAVFLGKDMTTEEKVAIKIEKRGDYSSIKHEVRMMNYLFQRKFQHLPKTHWYGKQDIYTCLVMSYYECSLLQWCSNKDALEMMGLRTIMYQCTKILSHIHGLFVIHRDIKPHHFMVKRGELVLIDFGLATFTIDENGELVPDTPQKTVIGTPNYISIHQHGGHRPGYRDDLISLGYMMLFLFSGSLPWEGCPNEFREPGGTISPEFLEHPLNLYKKSKKEWSVLSQVLETSREKFPELFSFMNYCHQLLYKDPPNYDLLLDLFQTT